MLAGAVVIEGEFFADEFEVADEVDGDGAVAAGDDAEGAVLELEGADAGVLDGVVGTAGVAEVAQETAGRLDAAAEVGGEIVEVDDLFEDLSAGFGAVAPPGSAVHVDPVASGEERGASGGTGVDEGFDGAHRFAETQVEADLAFHAGAFDGGDHVGGLAGREGDGFFEEDVDAAGGGELGFAGVGEGRNAEVNGVELPGVEHGGETRVVGRDFLFGGEDGGGTGLGVGDGGDGDAGDLFEAGGVDAGDETGAVETDAEGAGRRVHDGKDYRKRRGG